MDTCEKPATNRIQQLNDQFRSSFIGGTVVLTRGVTELTDAKAFQLTNLVRIYDSFDAGNDPYGEHDFGVIDLDQTRVFWKIDYYDKSLSTASPDPANARLTERVLTIMLAEEW